VSLDRSLLWRTHCIDIFCRFFGDIDEKVKKVMELQESEHMKSLTSRNHSDDKEMNEYKNSPATKWVGERMKNGNSSMTAEGKGVRFLQAQY
jgi:hypothetical protein